MARKAKVEKMGYALRINRTAEVGAEKWEMVGTLFRSRHQALEHKARYYPTVQKYTVGAVRLNVEPLPATGRPEDKAA